MGEGTYPCEDKNVNPYVLMLRIEIFIILLVLSTVTIICLKIPDFVGPGGHLKSNVQYLSNN